MQKLQSHSQGTDRAIHDTKAAGHETVKKCRWRGGKCRWRGRKRQVAHAVTVWNTDYSCGMPLCFGNEVGASAFASSAVGGPQAHSELQAAGVETAESCRRRGQKMQAAGRKRQMVHAVTVWNTETLAAMPLCFGNEMGAFALASSAVGGPQAQSCRRRGSKPLKVAGGGVANRCKRSVRWSFERLLSWWHGFLGLGEASGLLPVMLLRWLQLA